MKADPSLHRKGEDPLSALAVLRELTDAASRFVDRAPRQKRVEADRQALLDAITRAQLVLSVGGRRADESQQAEVKEAQALLRAVPGQPRNPTKPPMREGHNRRRKKS